MDTDKHRYYNPKNKSQDECLNVQRRWDNIKRSRTQPFLLACFISILFLATSIQIQAQTLSTPKTVDFEDFIAFAQAFNAKKGDSNFDAVADLNDNGQVDFNDFIGFTAIFGKTLLEPETPLTIKSEVTYNSTNNTSQITLTFSEQIRIVTTSSLSPTTQTINTETGEIENIDLTVQNTILDQSRENLTITIPNLISNNSRLILTKSNTPPNLTGQTLYLAQTYGITVGLWIYNAYQPITGEVTLSTPFTPAQSTLSLRPFAPTNINYFTPGVYTESTPMTPATSDTLTETTARAALETFLAKRITNPDTLQEALNKYDDANLIAKMPNPTLRAGLISLTGTLAQSAIDAITRGPFGPLAFGPITSGDYADVNSNRSVTVDERYATEAFPLFAPIFTRMALQLDLQTGRNEEITASSFLALVTMQQTLTDSTLAQSGTELSRRLNTQMLARLNSGQANFPNIGIYQTPNGQTFPNGTTFTSYTAVFAPLEDTITPANTLLTTYLQNLAPENTQLPTTTTYNTDILTFIDQHQNILSPEHLTQIAHTLKLTPQ